jgi:hypothetical protein
VVRALLAAALAACCLAARAAPDLFVEAELAPARVYVGGEARLTLRLYRAPGVTHGTLRPPELGDAADMSLLGPIRIYEARRAGVTYEVLERTHVIVPRRPGRLVVPGAEFEGALRSAEVLEGSQAPKVRSARGPQRALEVMAMPPGSGEPWLPARRLKLEETWSRDPAALASGVPVTRTLVLSADGIAAERLPRLQMAADPGLVVHHDRAELRTEFFTEGMHSSRVQRIVLMPVGDAEVSLPALSVKWWDVEADAPRVATIEGHTLRLHAGEAPPPPPEPPVASPRVLLRSLLAAIVLLIVGGLWWHLRTLAYRDARRALREACRKNDARRARDALVEWWQATRRDVSVPLMARMGEGWDDAARGELESLDAALYGAMTWDGAAFWRGVRPWLRRKAPKRVKFRAPALAPLHKLQASEYPVASSAAVHFGQVRSP